MPSWKRRGHLGGAGQSDGECAPFSLRTQLGAPIRFECRRVGGRAPDLVASVNGGLETGFLALKIGRAERVWPSYGEDQKLLI